MSISALYGIGASGSRCSLCPSRNAREVLAESRTVRGNGAAGAATVGAANVEVLQSVLA